MSKYAVITGDIVASSRLEGEERKALLRLLKAIFAEVKRRERGLVREFDIFWGDSFQRMVEDPRLALNISLHSAKVIGRLPWQRELEDTSKELSNAGRWIGVMERTLVPTFVLNNSISAIGLLSAVLLTLHCEIPRDEASP